MAEEAKQAAAAAPSDAAPASGGGNKVVMIITIVNLVITLGVAGLLFVSFKKEKETQKVEDISATPQTDGHAAAEGHGEAAKSADAHGAKDEKKTAKIEDFGKMINLDQFTINLATPGTNSPKFIRVLVSLEVPDEATETEVGQKIPQIRNTIIDLFNSKRPTDLAVPDGREYLKEEIKNALNGFLINGKVKGVYFTNFVMSN